jgi:hypothetical protein
MEPPTGRSSNPRPPRHWLAAGRVAMDSQGSSDQGPRQRAEVGGPHLAGRCRPCGRAWVACALLASVVVVVGLHIQPTRFCRSPRGQGGRIATSGSVREPQPAGGTMDTSRGSDGPIDSRADRQLRPTQGRHIMMWRQTWRQTWRQGWRPARTPSPTHHHDPRPRRQPVVHGCRVNPASTCGDHVLDRRSFQDSPYRPGALTDEWGNYRQRGKQPAQRLWERSWSEVICRPLSRLQAAVAEWLGSQGGFDGRGSLALQSRRRRPPAWRLGASGGRRSWASEPNRSGARDGAGRPATSYSASQYRQYSRIPHAGSSAKATRGRGGAEEFNP